MSVGGQRGTDLAFDIWRQRAVLTAEIGQMVFAPKERDLMFVGGDVHVPQHHWAMDVTFGEDRPRIRNQDSAENIAGLRSIARNLQ